MRWPRGHRAGWTGPSIGWGTNSGNHHGPKVDGKATTLRSTWLFCQLDNGMMPPPRFFWGIRLWLYAPSGRCCFVDFAWQSARKYAASDLERAHRADLYVEQQRARGEWPPAGVASPDYLAAMLGANGLGLTLNKEPRP